MENALDRLPVALQAEDRLELEMIVLDRDPSDAAEFLSEQGIEVSETADPLEVCTEWLRRLQQAEQKGHEIRFDEHGPTMDPFSPAT